VKDLAIGVSVGLRAVGDKGSDGAKLVGERDGPGGLDTWFLTPVHWQVCLLSAILIQLLFHLLKG